MPVLKDLLGRWKLIESENYDVIYQKLGMICSEYASRANLLLYYLRVQYVLVMAELGEYES